MASYWASGVEGALSVFSLRVASSSATHTALELCLIGELIPFLPPWECTKHQKLLFLKQKMPYQKCLLVCILVPFLWLPRLSPLNPFAASDLSTYSTASLISNEEQFEDYGEGDDVDFTPSSPCPDDESRTNAYSDLGSSVSSRLLIIFILLLSFSAQNRHTFHSSAFEGCLVFH